MEKYAKNRYFWLLSLNKIFVRSRIDADILCFIHNSILKTCSNFQLYGNFLEVTKYFLCIDNIFKLPWLSSIHHHNSLLLLNNIQHAKWLTNLIIHQVTIYIIFRYISNIYLIIVFIICRTDLNRDTSWKKKQK